MTLEEKEAVHLTDKALDGHRWQDVHRSYRRRGHAFVSQGCGAMRCVGCDQRANYATGECLEGYCSSTIRIPLKMT